MIIGTAKGGIFSLFPLESLDNVSMCGEKSPILLGLRKV